MKTLQTLADEWVEKYAFVVPYNGTDKFYNEEKLKYGRDGFVAGYEAAQQQLSDKDKETAALRELYELCLEDGPDSGGGYPLTFETFLKDINKSVEGWRKILLESDAKDKEIAELKAFITLVRHKDGYQFDEDLVKSLHLTAGIPWEGPVR